MSSDEMRFESAQALQGTVGGPAGEGNSGNEWDRPDTPAAEPHTSEVVSSIGFVEAVADTTIPDPERLGSPAQVVATAAPEHRFAASTIVIDTQSIAEPPDSRNNAGRQTREESAEAPGSSSTESARRRVRLNPLVDPADVRPIPNLGGSAAEVAEAPPAPAEPRRPAFDTAATPEVPAEVAAPSAETAARPEPAPRSATFVATAPVELPRDEHLSADLEAQIEAALAGEQFTAPPVAVAPPPPAEGEEAPAVTPSPTQPPEEELVQGTRLTGKVQALHGDDVFLDLGYRAPGVVSMRQFEAGKQPEVGQQFQVVVDRIDAGEGLIHCNLPRGRRRISGNWEAVSAGQTVDCMVTGVNKGGLEVTVSNLRGFLPASQVDLRFVSDLQQFVGQKLTVQVVEANPKKRNLVVSRRNHLIAERQEAEQNLWKTLATGQVFRGTVKTIKDYGAFVDIGGVDGFLHVGEMSWNRIRHPTDLLAEGQEVEVQVISLDSDKKRIGLGMKQLVSNPWQLAADKYAPGKTVSGRVTRTADFGAFIELEPGVEGLVHISELDYQRVRRVSDVLTEGQTIDVQVLEVIPDRKRISLSVKALKERPAEAQPPADEDLAPSGGEELQRRRRGPLKGGTGGASRGGLFGDPGRFT